MTRFFFWLLRDISVHPLFTFHLLQYNMIVNKTGEPTPVYHNKGVSTMNRKQQPSRPASSQGYDCPLTRKHVFVQLKGNKNSLPGEPAVCSSIGECGCNVVQIIYGMSYTVDWHKCCLYSLFKEQDSDLDH
ncbi:MAG: hypothetical protein D3912_15585 [Candidatus Electrothrix sp. AX1]|nr:hypothetical protein [Candidatus Electrothrix sp. AX1]